MPEPAEIQARESVARIQKALREQPARDRKYAVGYGWTPVVVDTNRVTKPFTLERVVVAVDPRQPPDETGIIVAGRDVDGDCYVLADYSGAVGPDSSVSAVLDAYREHHADAVVGVANLVGDYLKALLYRVHYARSDHGDPRAIENLQAFKGVTLMKGYLERFKPAKTLYEQGAVHHVGAFPELEDRMFTWMPGDRKPTGRIAALALALTELAGKDDEATGSIPA